MQCMFYEQNHTWLFHVIYVLANPGQSFHPEHSLHASGKPENGKIILIALASNEQKG